jgi:hypothetical protein
LNLAQVRRDNRQLQNMGAGYMMESINVTDPVDTQRP